MATASAQQARGVAEQVRARAAAQEAPPPPVPVPAEDDTDTVRQTVDLTRAHHVALAQWRMETGVALGRTRLSTQEVLAGLVALVLSDETVARRARAKIAETPERRRKRRSD